MSLVILNTLRTRSCRTSCEKKKDLWPHLRMKASLSTHELPRAKWLPFFKVVACKDFVTTRYAWFIAGPWYGMYDLLPVHDTVCMMYCRSMTRYVWFIAGPWYGMYDLLPVHDTVCKIYCRSMTRYVWFIPGPFSEWCGGYNSELERVYSSLLRYFIHKAEISNVKLEI